MSNLTLMDVFFKEEGSLKAKLSLTESGDTLSAIRKQLAKESNRITLPFLLGQAADRAKELMDVPIHTILVSAWGKYFALRKYLDQEKYPPNTTVAVEMSEHSVKSEHHPYLQLWINGVETRINFGISITLTLKSLILVIRNGRIRAVKAGECTAKGTVTCENIQIAERTSEPIPLPLELDLGDGIPLG